MIPYRVFKQDSEGVLHYEATSQALGTGIREFDLIVDGHQLRAGDVVELGGSWLIILGPSEYVYLPPYADSDFTFGDGCWCMQIVLAVTFWWRLEESDMHRSRHFLMHVRKPIESGQNK